MFIKQISIFAENRNGSVMEITQILGGAEVNIRALSIADTLDFGVVRLIVDKPELAIEALRAQNIAVMETDVIAVSVGDTPGSFNEALVALYEGEVMLEYAYAFVAPVGGGATCVLRCREMEKAVELLKAAGIRLLTQTDVA